MCWCVCSAGFGDWTLSSVTGHGHTQEEAAGEIKWGGGGNLSQCFIHTENTEL